MRNTRGSFVWKVLKIGYSSEFVKIRDYTKGAAIERILVSQEFFIA